MESSITPRYGGRAALLRNDGGHEGTWVRVALQGQGGNPTGVGARVRVMLRTSTGERTITRWVKAGSGYLSTSEPVVQVGLDGAPRADRVEVTWASGGCRPGRPWRRVG